MDAEKKLAQMEFDEFMNAGPAPKLEAENLILTGLVAAQQDYIELLGSELQSLAGYLKAHGYTTNAEKIARGAILCEEINKLVELRNTFR